MVEEELNQKEIIRKTTLKNGAFRVFFYYGRNETEEVAVFYKTNRPIFHHRLMGKETEESILNCIDLDLYTDEELLSHCSSLKELKKREKYLLNIYSIQIETTFSWDGYVFPMTSHMYGEDKEFIDHCTFLWAELQKLKRPTVFPEFKSYVDVVDRAERYYVLIPFAEPDDMRLPDIKEYFRKNARNLVIRAYYMGRRDFALKLVQDNLIKKPTLRKLLEMVNEKGDVQFAAILMNMLGENTKKERRFLL